jgi:hypothetical protein
MVDRQGVTIFYPQHLFPFLEVFMETILYCVSLQYWRSNNGQSRENGNIGYTRRRQTQQNKVITQSV